VVASEPGYHAQRVTVQSLSGQPATSLVLRLDLDRAHPRWPKPPEAGHLWLGGFAGYAGAHTMGAGAEAACPDSCTADPVTHGGMAAARLGYRFPMQLSLEIGLGYALFGTALRRLYREDFAGATERVSYELVDRPLVRGPFIAPSFSYRYPLSDWLAVSGRAALGVMIATASSEVDGVTATTGAIVPVEVEQLDVQHTVTLFVMPSLALDLTFGDWEIGAGLGVALFPLQGPALDNGPLRAQASPDETDAGAVGNAPASDALSGERAWGPLALWVPHLQVGYTF
jgi:hypothetical protein